MVTIWKSKKIPWNWLAVDYGIRDSKKIQIFPFWNLSHNGAARIIVGFGRLFVEVRYNKKGLAYKRWYYKHLPFKEKFWRLYNLLF